MKLPGKKQASYFAKATKDRKAVNTNGSFRRKKSRFEFEVNSGF
jgi:hypothetical protein